MAYSGEEIISVVQGATASGEYVLNAPPKSLPEKIAGMFVTRSGPNDAGVMMGRFLGFGETKVFIREGVTTITNPYYEPQRGVLMVKWPWEKHLPGYDVALPRDVKGTTGVKPEIEQLGNVTTIYGTRVKFRRPLIAALMNFYPDAALKVVPELKREDESGGFIDVDPYRAIAGTGSSLLDAVVAKTAIDGADEISVIARDDVRHRAEKIQLISGFFQQSVENGMTSGIPRKLGMEEIQGFRSVEVGISPTSRDVLQAQARADQVMIEGQANASVQGMTANAVTQGVSLGLVEGIERLIQVLNNSPFFGGPKK